MLIKADSYLKPEKKLTKWKITGLVMGIFIVVCTIFSLYGLYKPLPDGISYEGDVHEGNVNLLIDSTYDDGEEVVQDHVIFDHVHQMIDDADDFILVNMFLFNDDYDMDYDFPEISAELADALVAKKEENPEVDIAVITDPINTFYGSYVPDHFDDLKAAGIDLVEVDLTQLRDSNPVYSGFWRAVPRWFGNSENAWLPNPFSSESSEGTVRSYLELLNFKANHRKVVVNEQEGLITSANPHDASAYHSNIAFSITGDILHDVMESEKAVANMSGADADLFQDYEIDSEAGNNTNDIQLLTEGKIKEHLLHEINSTSEGDTIYVGAFYLSDRNVINALLEAAQRDAEIRLVLDANDEAFGREQGGIPNRPAASELEDRSPENLQIRWYNASGEQFHTKLIMFDREEDAVLIGGSSNFTRRNLADLNLETNLKVTGDHDAEVIEDARNYFTEIWYNEGAEYTLDYEEFADDSWLNHWLYRFQEWSGMSTF